MARHARMAGELPRVQTSLPQARIVIPTLVRNWCDALAENLKVASIDESALISPLALMTPAASALSSEAPPQTIEVGGSADVIVRAGFILSTVGVVGRMAMASVRSH